MGFSLCLKGRVYLPCVRNVMLYDSETWVVKEADLLRLEHNDMRMIRWICTVTLKYRNPSSELRERLGLDSICNWVRRSKLW